MNRTVEQSRRRAFRVLSTIFFALAAMMSFSQEAAGANESTIGGFILLRCSGPVDYTITDRCSSDFIQTAEGEHSLGRACIPNNFTEAQIATAMLQYIRGEIVNHPDDSQMETSTAMMKAADALWPC